MDVGLAIESRVARPIHFPRPASPEGEEPRRVPADKGMSPGLREVLRRSVVCR